MLYHVHAGEYSAYNEEQSEYIVIAKSIEQAQQLVYQDRKHKAQEFGGPYSNLNEDPSEYPVNTLTETDGIKFIADYADEVPGCQQ